MAPDRWALTERLFTTALALGPAARADFLRSPEVPDDLRSELGSLLTAHDAEGLLERPLPLVPGGGNAAAPDLVGSRVGPYVVVREVGRGGMGTVYEARRAEGGFSQRVALKRIRPDLPALFASTVRARFLREREVLAGLAHPAIARLLDGGETPDGDPYFAMEFVEGAPITTYADAARLGIRERVALVEAACAGVAYAHRQLVVHRDIKPSNVLVADGPAGPRPVLLDFGLAALLGPDPDVTALTAGLRPYTPEYAAPEQKAGGAVGTAADVWSLGVLLHRLLAGRRAFPDAARDVPEPPSRSAARAAVGGEPSAEAVATARGTTPDRLARQLRGDLDAVVARCLRPEPEARYPSADTLAADLRCWLNDHPVSARKGTRRYVAGRFLRRHRAGVAATALATVLLVAFVAALAVQTQRATAARDEAVAVSEMLVGLFRAAEPGAARGDTLTAGTLLDRGAARAETDLAGQPLTQAAVLEAIGRAFVELGRPDRADPLLRRALTLRGELLPDADSALARSWLQLAEAAYYAGRYTEAEDAFDTVARLERGRPDGPLYAEAVNGRGVARTDLGRLDAAERDLRAALARRTALGDDLRDQTAYNLGFVLRLQGRLAEAERLQRATLAGFRAAHPPGHTVLAHPLVELGRVLTEAGRPAEALPPIREAVAIRRATLPPSHWLTSVAEAAEGQALLALGRHAEGTALLRHSRAAIVATRGDDDALVQEIDAALERR